MGQYQQWLYYQSVDRRLRADLEALEIELAQIQEQLHTLERTIPPTDNIIILALASSDENEVPEPPSENTSPSTSGAAKPSSETISSALYGWSELPNFGPQDMQDPFVYSDDPLPLTTHPEMALLPEDMATFFDEHDPTEPQLELPWWLSKIAASAHGMHRTSPIDQESIRTNHLVQRWRERWGRPVSTEQPAENSEDTRDE